MAEEQLADDKPVDLTIGVRPVDTRGVCRPSYPAITSGTGGYQIAVM